MKIYVSGKMTGIENLNLEKFERARKELMLFIPSADVIIPHELEVPKFDGESERSWYARLLLNDLDAIRGVDAVVLLDDWKDSKGATAEFAFANAIGVECKTLETFLVLHGEAE